MNLHMNIRIVVDNGIIKLIYEPHMILDSPFVFHFRHTLRISVFRQSCRFATLRPMLTYVKRYLNKLPRNYGIVIK